MTASASIIASLGTTAMTDALVRVTPRFYTAVDLVCLRLDTPTHGDRGVDQRLDRDVWAVFSPPPDHVTTALDHPEDRWRLGCERTASTCALEPSAPAAPPVVTTAFGWPLMHVIRMAIECMGHVVVREVESHARPAQHPPPQGLRMTGNAGVGHIVDAWLTGRAQLALTRGVGVVAPVWRHLRAITRWTLDTVWPAQATHGLKTCSVVEERLEVYHGASIAHWAGWNQYQKHSEPPGREGAWSTPWNPYRAFHFLSKDIETFKANLQMESQREMTKLKSSLELIAFEHQVRFSRLHEKRAEIIASLYGKIDELYHIAHDFILLYSRTDESHKDQKIEDILKVVDEFKYYFRKHKIYFDINTCGRISLFENELSHACSILISFHKYRGVIDVPYGAEYKELMKSLSPIEREVKEVKKALEASFREILGVLTIKPAS